MINKFLKKSGYIFIACILAVSPCSTMYAAEPAREGVRESSGKEDAIDVFCPTDYPFLLFDDEDGGRRLTSQIFHIANYGKEDIVLDLSDARIEAKKGIDCKKLSSPVDAGYKSDSKDIFAFLKVVDIASGKKLTQDALQEIDIPMEKAVPKKRDYILTGDRKPESYKVVLKAANHDKNGKFISFKPESVFSFYIAGSATPNKKLNWKHGDISFRVNIRFQSASDEGNPEKTNPDELSQSLPEEPEEPSGAAAAGGDSSQLPPDSTLPEEPEEPSGAATADDGDPSGLPSSVSGDIADTSSEEELESEENEDTLEPEEEIQEKKDAPIQP